MTFILPSIGGGIIASPTTTSTAFSNDYSVDFDGIDDYMDLGSSTTYADTASAFSISAWFKLDTFSSYPAILQLKTNRSNGFLLATGALSLYQGVWFGSSDSDGFKGFSTNSSSVASSISSGWHHLVFTYDGVDSRSSSSFNIYIDGSAVTATTAVSIGSYSNINKSGHGDFSYFGFDGLIDELAIFNSELSASDVTAIYNSGVPADLSSYSPVGWWRMGDNDGGTGTTITDQGSGGNDGTLTNGPTFSTDVPSFNNTYSVDFDGTDDYMDIPDSTALETTEFTWSAWFYCHTINRYNIIVDTATNSSTFNGYILFVKNNDNKIRFSSYHSADQIDSTTVVSANTWYHVAVTHESGSDKLYVNGSLEASGSAPNFSVSDAANLRIGSSQIYSLYHDGLIDEASFFNSALSASDVSSIYNSGIPSDISSLSPVGWWRMGDNDGGTGTTITNQGSASSIDGTLTNGPTFSTTVPSFNTYSVDFDGVNDYMIIPDADIFSMGDGAGTDNAFSISAWFNADSIGSFVIAAKDTTGAREWEFRTITSQLHFYVFGTGGGYIGRNSSTTLSASLWYHVVATYDASKANSGIKLYINGSQVDNGNYSGGTYTAAANHTNQVWVGRAEISGTANGKIDEVAIFNSTLSASDVTAIYNSGVPNDISSLNPVGWWRMGDNETGVSNGGTTPITITDQGSGGNNGTLTNSPTFSTTVPS